MNSRDAAYDEEEQLRRAIEASKEDAIPEEPAMMVRRPKRGREESDECAIDLTMPANGLGSNPIYRKLESSKRQRTRSKSASPDGDTPRFVSREGSDEEASVRNGSSKKARNAARNQRDQKEKTERNERREEQERKRAEAASKRKGRAERRRADGICPPACFSGELDV